MNCEKKSLLKALSVLTEGDKPFRNREMKGIAESVYQKTLKWCGQSNVIGFGVAKRSVKGVREKELALKVYVKKKLPKQKVKKSASLVSIPTQFTIPLVEGALPVDVEEIGTINATQEQGRRRPAPGRFSVSHRNGRPGTLGCLVRKRGDENSPLFVLSNSHVFAPVNGNVQVGDPIYQPKFPANGNSGQDVIARLHDWEPFELTDERHHHVIDAAIAKARPSMVTSDIFPGGPPAGVSYYLKEDMQVSLGEINDSSPGAKIVDVNGRFKINYKDANGFPFSLKFREQIICQVFSGEGDSGSVVLNKRRKIVGLLFAASPTHSFFNRIKNVIDRFGIEAIEES